MITNEDARAAVASHLARRPQDRLPLADALLILDTAADLTRRESLPTHVTVGALCLDNDGHVLVVEHLAYGIPLQPGGHLKPEDRSLPEAALRELVEECGIDPAHVTLVSADPAYIEYGPVPARPSKGEPAHFHLDIGFIFTASHRLDTRAQTEEVASARWQPIDGIDHVLPGPVARALLEREPGWWS